MSPKDICDASRALKLSEKNYPVYKLEFLALKWAVVDKFNFYLYGSTFKVYTDNNPLTYIHRSLKVDAVTQRWLSALGDYDFSVHYKPGNTNTDADILSRLHEIPDEIVEDARELSEVPHPLVEFVDVSAISLEADVSAINTKISPVEWKTHQTSDPELCRVIQILKDDTKCSPVDFPKSYRKLFFVKNQLMFNKDDVLCKRALFDGVEHLLVVLPKSKLPMVLRLLHDESGHMGTDRVAKFFQRRFFLPGYSRRIDDYIMSCKQCVLKKSPVVKQGELGEVVAFRPFQTLSMDYLALDIDRSGYGHVLIVTDVFTKYAFAIPTKNETATTVAKVLMGIFNTFGLPERLLSDRGRNFESQVIEQLCTLLGVNKVFTCPYSPRSDAICERFNRTLISMVGTLSEEKRSNWSKYLGHMCNIYNSVHSSTGFAPFEMIFGRKSRLPVDIMLGTNPVETEYSSLRQYVDSLKTRLEFAFKVAQQSSDFSHLINKYKYDQRIRASQIKPGDKVLVRNVGVRGMHKLSPTWKPEIYEVVRQVLQNKRVYELKNLSYPRQNNRILHIDMLKPLEDFERLYKKSHMPGEDDIPLLEEELVQLFEDDDPVIVGLDSDTSQNVTRAGRSSSQKTPINPVNGQEDLVVVEGIDEETEETKESELVPIASQYPQVESEQAEHPEVHDSTKIERANTSDVPLASSGSSDAVDITDPIELSQQLGVEPEEPIIEDESANLTTFTGVQNSTDVDSDSSEDSGESGILPDPPGRPIRNRRRPNWFGNPVHYLLYGKWRPVKTGTEFIV